MFPYSQFRRRSRSSRRLTVKRYIELSVFMLFSPDSMSGGLPDGRARDSRCVIQLAIRAPSITEPHSPRCPDCKRKSSVSSAASDDCTPGNQHLIILIHVIQMARDELETPTPRIPPSRESGCPKKAGAFSAAGSPLHRRAKAASCFDNRTYTGIKCLTGLALQIQGWKNR